MAIDTLSEPSHHPSKLQPGLPGIGVPRIPGSATTAEGSVHLPERRRHARSRIAGPRAATVIINDKNAALMANLSEGGMRVQALARRLERGANLRLQFQLPGSPEPIHTSGVVAWVSDSAEAGIRFAGLSRSLARRLREWLAKNQVSNAAREFMKVAGGWQAALDLMTELTRMLTGARDVAITLAASAKPPIPSPAEDAQPVRATVAAPIYESESIIGHLEISSTELGAFDEQDLGLLPVLASVVGEMIELRTAQLRERAPKIPPLPARIASRLEGMFPTIRVRLVP